MVCTYMTSIHYGPFQVNQVLPTAVHLLLNTTTSLHLVGLGQARPEGVLGDLNLTHAFFQVFLGFFLDFLQIFSRFSRVDLRSGPCQKRPLHNLLFGFGHLVIICVFDLFVTRVCKAFQQFRVQFSFVKRFPSDHYLTFLPICHLPVIHKKALLLYRNKISHT